MKELQVEKTYWASVSGGKDSLKMLHIILENPQKSGNMNRNINAHGRMTHNIDNVLGHVYKKWIPLLHEKLKGEENNDIL